MKNYIYEPKKIINGLPIEYSKKGLKQLRQDSKKGYWRTVDKYDEDAEGNLVVVGKDKEYVSFVHVRNLNFKIVSKKEAKKIMEEILILFVHLNMVGMLLFKKMK